MKFFLGGNGFGKKRKLKHIKALFLKNGKALYLKSGKKIYLKGKMKWA